MSKYIEVIKEKNPNLIIEDFSFNEEGQNNDVVIVNDSLIFKFPKYLDGIEKLKKEVKILDSLNSYITLDIPEYEYVNLNTNDVGRVYAGYKIIKGVSLKQDIFRDIKKKGNVSKKLATFLKQLHSIPLSETNIDEIVNISKSGEWVDLFERIEKKLFPFMKKESKVAVTKNFNNFLKQGYRYNKTLIHGDFGPTNIIFDSNNQTLSGVIDFNDIAIGDPAIDVASLIGPFGYGEDFVKSFESIYPNIEALLERAKFYASTFALQEALFGIEFDDKEAFTAGIKDYL